MLGGGGVTGIAWEVGVLHGLQRAGVDLTDADVIVGTSAGSVVAAMVGAGVPLDLVYAVQAGPTDDVADRGTGAHIGALTYLRLATALLRPGPFAVRRARVGRMAMAAVPGDGAERAELISRRLALTAWPDRDVRIVAVRADSGETAVFTPARGVPLSAAVAASCAAPLVWAPMTIGGIRYLDGGVRSSCNVDVAGEVDSLVVLAPIPLGYHPATSLRAQARRTGAQRFVVLSPDRATRRHIGLDNLSMSARPGAAMHGLRQGELAAEAVARAWQPPATSG